MASREELLADLAAAADEALDIEGQGVLQEPVSVLRADLGKLNFDDLPLGVSILVLEKMDAGVMHLAFSGVLTRVDEVTFMARVEEHGWRKYWTGSLGVEEYHDLIRASVEARARSQGDVLVQELVNEDVLYGFTYDVALPTGDLRRALDHAVHVRSEVVEAAEAVRIGIDDLVTITAKRLNGWGTDPLGQLIDKMRQGTPNDKGRVLEELVSRLFNTVSGFAATGHVVTETEEIDIRIQNSSDDAYWRRESSCFLLNARTGPASPGKMSSSSSRTSFAIESVASRAASWCHGTALLER